MAGRGVHVNTISMVDWAPAYFSAAYAASMFMWKRNRAAKEYQKPIPPDHDEDDASHGRAFQANALDALSKVCRNSPADLHRVIPERRSLAGTVRY